MAICHFMVQALGEGKVLAGHAGSYKISDLRVRFLNQNVFGGLVPYLLHLERENSQRHKTHR